MFVAWDVLEGGDSVGIIVTTFESPLKVRWCCYIKSERSPVPSGTVFVKYENPARGERVLVVKQESPTYKVGEHKIKALALSTSDEHNTLNEVGLALLRVR